MQAAYADHLHKPINCSDDLPQTCRPEYAKQREFFTMRKECAGIYGML